MTLVHDFRRALVDAGALLMPVDCAACGLPGRALCDACAASLAPRVEHRALGDGFDAVSGLAFAGTAAAVVRAFKEQGRTGLARALAPSLRTALVASAVRAGGLVEAVPVPSRDDSLRRRGYRPVELLLHHAGVAPLRALRWTRRTADQRGLDRPSRDGNLRGALAARRTMAGRRVVVVDDVLTTGATLREARRALADAGAEVVGAVTLAATPRVLPPRTRHGERAANSS